MNKNIKKLFQMNIYKFVLWQILIISILLNNLWAQTTDIVYSDNEKLIAHANNDKDNKRVINSIVYENNNEMINKVSYLDKNRISLKDIISTLRVLEGYDLDNLELLKLVDLNDDLNIEYCEIMNFFNLISLASLDDTKQGS